MRDADAIIVRTPVRGAPAVTRIYGDSIAERLRSAVEEIDARIVFTTSFGIEDQLLTHHIVEQDLPIELVTLDTGRLFPSTYKLWQATEEHYGRRIRALYPDPERLSGIVADSGINGFYYSKDARLACCDVRKVEPLARALSGAAGWVTGLRGDQSARRDGIPLAAWDDDRRLIKMSPLFDWRREEVAAECARLAVPINELHAKGFPSIGCEPCTRAVRPGELERAGRWWWEQDGPRECGLHVDADGRLARVKAA
jgi:phosphoadenosine phosphosulfate reductase